jgi:hypothetical protein
LYCFDAASVCIFNHEKSLQNIYINYSSKKSKKQHTAQ